MTTQRAENPGPLAKVKKALRARRASGSAIVRHGISTIFAAYRAGQFFVDGRVRSVVLLNAFNKEVHQTTLYTSMDRYPGIFAACQSYFAGRKELRILSYGCATGEEVVTLRRYFPRAFITGAEINRRSLAICKSGRPMSGSPSSTRGQRSSHNMRRSMRYSVWPYSNEPRR